MRKVAVVAAVGVLAFSGVVVAQPNDEPVDFTLDCTVTGRTVECVGELPTEEPPSTSTSTAPASTATPTTTTSSSSSTPTTTDPATPTEPSTSSSAVTTTTTSSPPATTTTTQPATTSTTQPSTSTTQPAPSSTTPTGDGFLATFATPADFYDRFDTYTGNYCTFGTNCRPEDIPSGIDQFPGDHNHACEGPTTLRTVDIANHANLFWHCAPNGPDTGHVMVALNTSGYAITGFTPDRSFTNLRSVCWDQNLTDLGGGKWFTVTVVPHATFISHPNTNPRAAQEGEGPFRLDYTLPEFDADNAPGDFNLQRQPRWQFKLFRNELRVFDRVGGTGDWGTAAGFVAGADRATRFRHCLTENAQGDVILTQRGQSWNTGTAFPDGEVHVIFADDTYDADKHGGTGLYTWHVDNIEIR
jgi:hypothetical protein